MNSNGKFKKITVILMIAAVAISVISLAWVIIFKDEDEYVQTNKEFYEQTSQTKKQQTAVTEKSDGDEMFNVEITVPVTFILEDINYNSQLTSEQEEAGFKSVTYDGENTVTYLISKANHRKFLLSYRYEILEELEHTLKVSYPYFEELECTDDLSQFTVRVNASAYNPADAESVASAISLPSMVYQLYAKTETSCSVSIVDRQTGRVIETVTP